jgi:hypothetical protein
MPWRITQVSALYCTDNPAIQQLRSSDGAVYRFRNQNLHTMEAMISVAAAAKSAGSFINFFENQGEILVVFWA